MATWTISGGPLQGGTASVTGFKHALVPLIAAAVLAERPSQIGNVPLIDDTWVLAEVLRYVGADARIDADGRSLLIDPSGTVRCGIPASLSTRIHGAIYLIPALLGRLGRIRVGAIGGCRIGSRAAGGTRPIGHVVAVLERFGAAFSYEDGCLVGASSGFRGATVDLADFAVVDESGRLTGPCHAGATKAAILAAAVADGQSVLRRPYRKHDVDHLVATLRASGLDIDEHEGDLVIQGAAGAIPPLSSQLPPDLLQVMTLLTLAVHWQVNIAVTGAPLDTVRSGLAAEIGYLARMGVDVRPAPDGIGLALPERLRAVDIEVTPQSIFSDSHPFFALMLSSADAPSRIVERVWVDRFDHVTGMNALGARISVAGATATIAPRRPWRVGQQVVAADLRSAAVLVLATIGLPGQTRVRGVEHLSRGYDNLAGTLQRFGAEILEGDFPGVGARRISS